jgi:hypothetical protein
LLIQQSDLVQSSFCLAKFHPMTPILEKELCNVALPVLCNVALPVLCNVALPVLCNVALRSGCAYFTTAAAALILGNKIQQDGATN